MPPSPAEADDSEGKTPHSASEKEIRPQKYELFPARRTLATVELHAVDKICVEKKREKNEKKLLKESKTYYIVFIKRDYRRTKQLKSTINKEKKL